MVISVSIGPGALLDEVYAALASVDAEAAGAGLTPGGATWVLICKAPVAVAAICSLSASGPRVRVAPALVLVAEADVTYTRADALIRGADDLISWPGGERELAASVTAILRRRASDVDVNPLTGFQGASALSRDIDRRIGSPGTLALLALDLHHFKAFNDRYGFDRGDGALRLLADCIEKALGEGDRAYHAGGDDFFVVTAPDRADGIATSIIRRFDGAVPDLCDDEDIRAGYVPGLDRLTGEVRRFPLISLTVACSTNEAEDVRHRGVLAQILAELKDYTRRNPGSGYARDRRETHDVARSLELRDETPAERSDQP